MDGYEFVKLPGAVRRANRTWARFDQKAPRAIDVLLKVDWTTEQPIHIGSGTLGLRQDHPVRLAVRVVGKPGIPGSSLRGVLRARYEAMTLSCAIHGAPRDARLDGRIPSRHFQGYQVQFSQDITQHPVFERCEGRNQICPACALFGVASRRGESLRSRVSVRDVVPISNCEFKVKGMPLRFEPRPHHLGEFRQDLEAHRLEVTELHGRKFYTGGGPAAPGGAESVEAIPEGEAISGFIVGRNVVPEELGGILASLGYDPPTFIMIGSGKAHGFGRMRLTALEARVRGQHGPVDATTLAGWRSAFVRSEDYFQDGESSIVRIHSLGRGQS